MKKKKYEAPSVETVRLRNDVQLLSGSGLNNPEDYPSQPDPFNY